VENGFTFESVDLLLKFLHRPLGEFGASLGLKKGRAK
jgi:hypothetical protein